MLTLVKGRHTWRVRCESAEAPGLLPALADVASEAGLSSLDLSILALQLQEHFTDSTAPMPRGAPSLSPDLPHSPHSPNHTHPTPAPARAEPAPGAQR